jgi:hypothetical protein
METRFAGGGNWVESHKGHKELPRKQLKIAHFSVISHEIP